MLTFDYGGKSVLITGAGRGLGFAMARAFLDSGARVYLNDRTSELVAAAIARLSSSDRLVAAPADLSEDRPNGEPVAVQFISPDTVVVDQGDELVSLRYGSGSVRRLPSRGVHLLGSESGLALARGASPTSEGDLEPILFAIDVTTGPSDERSGFGSRRAIRRRVARKLTVVASGRSRSASYPA